MDESEGHYSRRDALKKMAAGAGGVGALAGGAIPAAARPSQESSCVGDAKLGISTYSYWHFLDKTVPIEMVIDEASSMGVGAVDVLHRQMESEDPAYLRKLRRYAMHHGVNLNCLSIHQDFVSPDPDERQEHIEHTKKCLRIASDMGIPTIRLNSGGWGTVESFDKLMELDGQEPPLEGYTNDDAFEWCIESIREVIPTAEKYGVMMALENHWGLTITAEGVLRIVEAIDSPWLGVLADTGNFPENTYEQLEMLAPYTILVSAKTYYGGGVWYSKDLDYNRIADIFRSAGYEGYVTLEFEGEEDAHTAVPRSINRLREAFS